MADAQVRTRGTRFYIGTTAATAASDTYAEIEGARAVDGAAGLTWSQIDATVLTDGYKKTMKGVADAGSLTLGGPILREAAAGLAAGLAALKAAAEDDADPDIYNVKVADADGRITYLKVRVFSFTIQRGNNSNLLEYRSQLLLQAAVTEAAPA